MPHRVDHASVEEHRGDEDHVLQQQETLGRTGSADRQDRRDERENGGVRVTGDAGQVTEPAVQRQRGRQNFLSRSRLNVPEHQRYCWFRKAMTLSGQFPVDSAIGRYLSRQPSRYRSKPVCRSSECSASDMPPFARALPCGRPRSCRRRSRRPSAPARLDGSVEQLLDGARAALDPGLLVHHVEELRRLHDPDVGEERRSTAASRRAGPAAERSQRRAAG